ncbi:hypothetical protein AB1Y20_023385 [Prymnesium parvum]|uniref:Uncharacterized protein n=1 Tax=Prymnesium parvum TaxID=97485 RepID=A0AB34JEC3_PRYPA
MQQEDNTQQQAKEAKTSIHQEMDAPMQDEDETTEECKISELYVSKDMEAFQIDRRLTIQRKLQAKDPTNKDVVKNLANELKLHQNDSLTKIILTNSKNTYPFSDDNITAAISTEIFEVLEIEAESEEISINRLGRAGCHLPEV